MEIPWNDPYFLIEVISSTIFAVTIIFLILDIRHQKKALLHDSYSKLRSDHSEQKKSLVSDEVLRKLISLQNDEILNCDSLSEDEKKKDTHVLCRRI